VPPREQATDSEFYRFGFADDDFTDLPGERLDLLPHE
jgi:hypothetical protein